jgi:hypothetical protein
LTGERTPRRGTGLQGREGKGREGKEREGKGREGKIAIRLREDSGLRSKIEIPEDEKEDFELSWLRVTGSSLSQFRPPHPIYGTDCADPFPEMPSTPLSIGYDFVLLILFSSLLFSSLL